MGAPETVDRIIGIIFFLCYAYQLFYIPVVWLRRPKKHAAEKQNDFAVLISARNEQAVIGDLIASLRSQTYPAERIHIFVAADNCTDNTADIAREAGAVVYERSNNAEIGKGYALGFLMENIRRDYSDGFDGYFVFDADNILSPDFIERMNRTFSDGHDIVTSYRNSKNYGDNWISAGYALWYLRDSRYLNQARYLLGTSCVVFGTGFLFSRAVAEKMGPWPYHTLIEDVEFSAQQILNGQRIAFCPDAILYDEQPTSFAQSWRQRSRWCSGALQVFTRYGGRLLRGIFRGSFSCYDIAFSTMPAYILSAAALVLNVLFAVFAAVRGEALLPVLKSFAGIALNAYAALFVTGCITTATEWKLIRTTAIKKVLYAFTFPLFMATYVPIAISVLFRRVEWKPIEHRVSAAKLMARGKEEALPFELKKEGGTHA
ncbi:MAG: glycosyltransferase family 2 protein [Clostridia bacterium]|nr:glycosyltransferase family 2 protein [Clostridia bacterium]